MLARRILSLWFPRLAAERWVRAMPELAGRPFAAVGQERGALVLASLSVEAEAVGLRVEMRLADARAVLPELLTRPVDPVGEERFLHGLARWAERLSPWVSVEEPEGLVLDVSGCAHLFGNEAGLVHEAVAGLEGLGLTVRAGLADTVGAAWAMARYGGRSEPQAPVGDVVGQEVYATRSRAGKRAPVPARVEGAVIIVPPGEGRTALGPLPVAALRLEPEAVAALAGLGFRRVEDVAALPRAQLARRFGVGVVQRLDQALGLEPEPVAATRPGAGLAVRLTFPEPLGFEGDVLAGFGRLADVLAARLLAAGLGVRRVRAVLERVDGEMEVAEAGFARPVYAGETIMAVLGLKVARLEAGFGFEVLRLAAVEAEPGVVAVKRRGRPDLEAVADLVGRLGGRLGIDALVRLHPADSHVPEKGAMAMAAGFARAATIWPARRASRPLVILPPEPVIPEDGERPPRVFLWRRRRWIRVATVGPERIAPEWWLDNPMWRSGPRTYWRMETADGTRFWLFEALGGEILGGWFIHGLFD